MTHPGIEYFTHHCVVREGPLEGNKVATEVSPDCFAYFNGPCEHCGQPLATPNDIIAFLYSQYEKEQEEKYIKANAGMDE